MKKKIRILVGTISHFDIAQEIWSNLDTLASLLITDLASVDSISIFRDWAYSDEQYGAADAYQLFRYKGYIYINLEFEDYPEDDQGNDLPMTTPNEFKISIEEFLNVLDEWEKILELRPEPKEIIITQDDNNKISFEVIK